MRNPGNRVIVRYPNNGLRVRNCQTTVRPTQSELGPVRSFNDWQMYLRFHNDAQYRASHAFDTIMGMENLLCDAHELLIKAS